MATYSSQAHATRCRASALLIVVMLCAAGIGCSHRQAVPQGTSSSVSSDSILGAIAITGSAFDQQIILRVPRGSRRLAATSAADSAALMRLSGVEIVARGRNESDQFMVSNFVARSVDGSPVVDGVLRIDAGRLLIETETGSQVVSNPPGALLSLVGARVWVSGRLDTRPSAFGVIVPPR
jgi:hypothetical protein